MNSELLYVSAACNAAPNTCDWGQNNLICYASCNSIIIYNPKYPGTNKDLNILTGHTDKVCAVKWIKIGEGIPEKEIISTSVDKTARVWSVVDNYKYKELKGHDDGVNKVDCLYKDAEKGLLIVATGSIDSTIKIWERKQFGEDFENIQAIDLQRGLCVSIKILFLPDTKNIIIACGRDTSKVELYTQNVGTENDNFKLSTTLIGHENWVPGIDIAVLDNSDMLLVSSSQDKFIRLWRITEYEPDENSEKFTFKDLVYDLSTVVHKFTVKTNTKEKHYKVAFESVICGHEGWVYEVRFAPKMLIEDKYSQPLKLISCSLDKTMIIWSFEESTQLWMDTVRVGEIGGNTLGFYGCKFSPDGLNIIGHGYLGSLHLWSYNSESSLWKPGITPKGHSNQVVDIDWDPKGAYIMSVSYDQTTRIHAPWVRVGDNTLSWHEIARPQIHGYDMSCLGILSRYKFVSGAEEKIVRVFEAPRNFIENFRLLCNIKDDPEGDLLLNSTVEGPRGASVPSLGLSNKAVYESTNADSVTQSQYEEYPDESYFRETQFDSPPTEEILLQNTLWPETQKLYGHGYEIFAVAGSHDGKLVASACKSTVAKHASLILWDMEKVQQIQVLQSHNLTVTRIRFSPDDQKILSVSRDRRFTVFERIPESNEFQLAGTSDKKTGKHGRIIWCCDWSHDSKYFVTCSRDGKAIIWSKNENKDDVNTSLKNYEAKEPILDIKDQAITAVAFSPIFIEDSYLVCLGFESGEMKFYKWNETKNWKLLHEINTSNGHHKTVKRIRFRPFEGQSGVTNCVKRTLQVASCGSDYAVKLHNLYF